LVRRAVFDALARPALVVSQDGAVVFAHGDLEPFIRMPRGDNPRFDLNSILRSEYATRIRGALYKCRRSKETVTTLSSPDSATERVRINAIPAPKLGDEAVIISFERVPQDNAAEVLQDPAAPKHEALIDQLERELLATREDLRNTVEELETSNEERRSSNEESMSMNEELQSANEELEATTEELCSLNEELTTVNSELREKVDQLEQTNDDLHNFFASTKIATVFLDDKLCIKRFTPAAQTLLGIDLRDTGR
jgi:two-component system CheB/CheR fusion protein